jgi:molybdopterin-guanine dinucleotide biosynthesis protein MobB
LAAIDLGDDQQRFADVNAPEGRGRLEASSLRGAQPRGGQRVFGFSIPVLGFAAYSGTGKTTLLLELLPLLAASGLRVAVVKHAHHSFEPDQEGKDSYRLRKAGAEEMLVASRHRMAWIAEFGEERDEPRLAECLAALDPSLLDLVLVEGFKHEAFPKIELHRAALGKPLLFPADPNILAVATDGVPPTGLGELPHLSINDPGGISDFILENLVRTWPRTGTNECDARSIPRP